MNLTTLYKEALDEELRAMEEKRLKAAVAEPVRKRRARTAQKRAVRGRAVAAVRR